MKALDNIKEGLEVVTNPTVRLNPPCLGKLILYWAYNPRSRLFRCTLRNSNKPACKHCALSFHSFKRFQEVLTTRSLATAKQKWLEPEMPELKMNFGEFSTLPYLNLHLRRSLSAIFCTCYV